MEFANSTFLIVVNLFLFYAFIGLGIVINVIGKYYSFRQRLAVSWVLLSIGVVIFAFRNLLDALLVVRATKWVVLAYPVIGLVSSILIITGTIVLILEGSIESTNLIRREEELKELMDTLKEKYLKRQLTESELSDVTKDVIKELAEIEVKLKGTDKSKGKAK